MNSLSFQDFRRPNQRSAKPSSPVRIRAAPLIVSTRQQAAENDSPPAIIGFPTSFIPKHSIQSSRPDATRCGHSRPLNATENAPSTDAYASEATIILRNDELIEVMDAWPNLSEAIRAGILAMVRSAATTTSRSM